MKEHYLLHPEFNQTHPHIISLPHLPLDLLPLSGKISQPVMMRQSSGASHNSDNHTHVTSFSGDENQKRRERRRERTTR
ncbi:hypothetical protein HanXRQr2_Chr17g0816321 [Helianthus annuus]|uniref:Uncharacterized protein n=1 Tax=Helianthus annuus TaxID=4232 RepID=A0A251RSH5_HELAN|nr:hypothetical protein HanXRQr2_Chr17g0816321 [Helianthus annuus]